VFSENSLSNFSQFEAKFHNFEAIYIISHHCIEEKGGVVFVETIQVIKVHQEGRCLSKTSSFKGSFESLKKNHI